MVRVRSIILILIVLFILNSNLMADDTEIKFGFSERFRLVTWDNPITLQDSAPEQSTFTRHRTSFSAKWTPSKQVELFGKLTNEFRYYFTPEDREFTIHELFIDQLYVKFNRPFNSPFVFTIGRQNIIMDEGFVILEAHPLDGSRSIYFNAVRADVMFSPNSLLTGFYSYQPVTDNILPVVNELEQQLIEQPQEGYGLYFKGKYESVNLSAYYIHKNVESTENLDVESSINTIGARSNITLSNAVSFTAEGALQTGTFGNQDISAFGGYFHLDSKTGWKAPLPAIITLGGVYLSGDDQTTSEYEGWDPVFSRWPKWSESYIYTLIVENRVAYWNNFTSLYAKMNLNINKSINLDAAFHMLGSAENILTERSFPGGTGTKRGDLIILKLNFKLLKSVSGHILWEGFKPGDFYFDGASGYNWFRFELLYRL